MKIAFIGNFEAEFSTENYHKKTFEALGHEVVCFQENRTSTREILAGSNGVNMLYFTHTHGFKIGNDAQVIDMFRVFKSAEIPTVGYHLDLWLGLQRESDLKSDPYWNIEHFFTVDKLMADWLNANTKTKGHFLPAGVPESEAFIGTPNLKKYPHEIIFTGSKGYHKEYPYRVQLIDWLASNYGSSFAHYGGGGRETVRGKELNTLYASCKIVIGDTLCKGFTYPEYLSDRFFEVPGRGGFMIFPYIQGADRHLESNEEVVFYEFGDFDDLKSKIDHYLQDTANREAIRLAGFERARRDHTYKHRIEHIIKTLFP
jgi:Glycosyl transferases group 1